MKSKLRLGLSLASLFLGMFVFAGCDLTSSTDDSETVDSETASQSLNLLSEEERDAAKGAFPSVIELDEEIKKLKEAESPDFESLSKVHSKAFTEFEKVKKNAEREGVRKFLLRQNPKLSKNDQDEQILDFIKMYYKFYQKMVLAQKILGSHSRRTDEQIKNLELTIPTEEAKLYLDFATTDSLRRKEIDKAYETKVELIPVFKQVKPPLLAEKSNLSRIALSTTEMQSVQMQSLIASPTEGKLIDQMVFEALKIDINKQEMINQYLYQGQKTSALLASSGPLFALPGTVRPKDAPAVQDETIKLYKEDVFRKQFLLFLHKFYKQYVSEIGDYNGDENIKLSPQAEELVKNSTDLISKLSRRFVNHLNPQYAQAVSVVPRNFALSFLELNSSSAFNLLKEKLMSSPFYLSDKKPEELAAILKQILQENIYDVLRFFLRSTVFANEKKEDFTLIFSDTELYDYLSTVHEFVEKKIFTDSVITGEDVSNFIKNDFKPADWWVAQDRYSLAKKVIFYSRILEQLKEETDYAKEHGNIPESHLPDDNNIDLGAALESVTPDKDLPLWMIESLKTAAHLAQSKSDKENKKFIVAFKQAPKEILTLVKNLMDSDSAFFDAVKTKHLALNKTTGYKWNDFQKKLEKLLEEVAGSGPKSVVLNLLKLNKISEKIGSEDLKNKIHKIVEAIYTAMPTVALDTLYKEIDLGVSYVESGLGSELIENTITDKATRGSYYRKKFLSEPEKYAAYIQFKTDELRVRYPILFIPIKLPEQFKTMTGISASIPKPLPLYTVVSSVLRFLGTSGIRDDIAKYIIASTEDVSLAKDPNFLSIVRPMRKTSEINDLQKIVAHSLLNGLEPADFWDAAKKAFVDFTIGYWDFASAVHESKLEDWPVDLRLREIIPAKVDETPDPFVDAGKKRPSLQTRTERAVISALLQPYLFAAREKTQAEIGVLQGSTTEIEALLKTEVIGQLIAASGGALGGGITKLQEEYGKRMKSAEKFKEWTTELQEINNQLFPLTMYTDIGEKWHFATSTFMIFAITMDFSADFNLMLESMRSYRSMQAFSNSGLLGAGLISFSSSDQVREHFAMQIEMLLERFPLDFSFFWGTLMHNWIPNRKFAFYKVREWISGTRIENFVAKESIDYEAFKTERDNLSNEIVQAANIGVQYGVSPRTAGIWSKPADLEASFSEQLKILNKERDKRMKQINKTMGKVAKKSPEHLGNAADNASASLDQINEFIKQAKDLHEKIRKDRTDFYNKYKKLTDFMVDKKVLPELPLK